VFDLSGELAQYTPLPPVCARTHLLIHRAVARSENLGGHIVLGGDNVPPLVEIGSTDLPKCPPAPPLATGPLSIKVGILCAKQKFAKPATLKTCRS
jgi:hypothetical protein